MILTNIKLNRSKEIILDIKKKDMTNVYKICLNLAKKDTKTTSTDITLVFFNVNFAQAQRIDLFFVDFPR